MMFAVGIDRKKRLCGCNERKMKIETKRKTMCKRENFYGRFRLLKLVKKIMKKG